MEAKIRYRIKGKIYYKVSEETLKDEDYSLVDGIWRMVNPKGESFRLLIGHGGKRYTLYTLDTGKFVLKTNSISKVEK
jgi:hypothetical protein